jgi:HK97 family phage portal protein
MGIFSRFQRAKTPQNSLSTSRSVFWGGSTSGVFVSEMTAMQTASVYACVRVIAETIASLPLHVYRYEKHGTRLVPEHPLFNLLHNAPNPEMTSFVFRETLMSHILLWGNGYAQILRDGGGRALALYPLLPGKMDVGRGDDGQLYYTYWRDRDETRPHEKVGGVALRREDVLHIPGLSYDGLVGYSPIALAKNAVGMAIATEEYGASFFANGANPGGILEHPQAIKNPASIRDAWEALYKGARNSGKVAVLEDGLKFHQVSIPPEQAQFLETRKFQLNEIARIFRVPPHMIGDLEKSTYSNIEHQSLEFVKFTIEPWVVRIEQALHQSLVLPSEKNQVLIKFNMDSLLRGDYETRMKGYSIGIQNGFLSPNDVRRLEDMNLIPAEEGGDAYICNGNMVRLKDVGAAYGKGGDDA